ncbi:MAG: hypothetical protein M0R17_02820 [Candidatus Omnitrophica bacterium]|jgi:hypothetical protein|nr:hypothetical protein [Candidatus Omnitrophota bacterium]
MKKDKTFIIYELSFDTSDSYYIGKTYNMTHRMFDHIYSATKKQEKNHRANWFRKHINEKPNIKILYSTKLEQDAYQKELEFIKLYIKDNKKLVNTQRLKEAGGLCKCRILSIEQLEKLRKIFGKKYILINKEGKIFRVNGLKSWAEKRNLNYKDLNSVAREKFNSSQNYIVFYRDKWKLKTKEEKLKIIENYKNYNQFNRRANELKKIYYILYNSGKVKEVFGLTNFCRDNNYNTKSVQTAFNTKSFYKDIKPFKTIEKLKEFSKNEGINLCQ